MQFTIVFDVKSMRPTRPHEHFTVTIPCKLNLEATLRHDATYSDTL